MTARGQIYISYYKSPYHRGLAPAPPSLIQSHGLCLLGPKTTDSTFAECNFEALASWGGFLKWGPGTVHTQSLEMLGLKKKKRQNPDLDSQTSPGAVELDPWWGWGQEPAFHTASPTRHPKVQSVSLTLGRGGGDCLSSSLPSRVKCWRSDSWAPSQAHRGRQARRLASLAAVMC